VKLRLENLPSSLAQHRDAIERCLDAMNRALPLRAVYLFGSYARGDARADSDVDFCLVADGAERQLEAAQRFRNAIWDIRGKPAFTLLPIAPQRLKEKQAIHDPFFETVLREGVPLAEED
jgi:predicted nucleotidyltransferase